MTGDDHLPQTLPLTQDADAICFTQSQDLPSSQHRPVVWGRLCPVKLPFKSMEMTKDIYSLGRSESCDITATTNELKPKWLSVMSKIHFRITREIINNETNDNVVYLEDLSQNGTFVNKKKVGKGNRVVLESNDVISLVQPIVQVYVYMSTTAFETNDLPMELRNKYAVSRKLGSGACGEVKLVFSKVGCKRFAMKTIVKAIGTANSHKHALNDPEKIMNEVEFSKR